MGVIAHQQGRHEAALVRLQGSIALEPNQASTLGNLGLVLDALRRFDEAIDSYRRALALRPNDPDLHYNLGNALLRADQPADAVLAYRKSLALRPDHGAAPANMGSALNNLGHALKTQGDLENGIAAFRQAMAARPFDPAVHSNLLLSLQYDPDLDAAALADEHRQWDEHHAGPIARRRAGGGPNPSATALDARDPDRRLRIGYVSADFRQHAVARFLLPLITNHDPERVELYAYSQVNPPDPVTEKFRACMSVWRDVTLLSDADVAERVRSDRIDILVDLAGHTAGNRLLVFAHRPAPVQVTYLGYPGTTGLRDLDYRLTDAIADPPGRAEPSSSERLLRVEPCAWCFQPAADVPLSNREPGPITFGSFNTFAKLNRVTVGAWGEILRAVPGSRLLLKSDGLRHPTARQRVRAQFAELGIAASRLEMRGQEPAYVDHLALYGRVDIALDTFPYNGTTTTCEALWMGVPVITRVGDRHASRVGLSLLTQLGLTGLTAGSPEEFVEVAIRLAADRPRLAELHRTLRRRMEASPLMDGRAFAVRVEDAYRHIWRAWCTDADERAAPVVGPAPPSPAEERPMPDDREAWMARGLAALQAGDAAAAASCFGVACAADGSDAEPLNFLGVALQQLGRLPEARSALERAAAADPDWADPAYNLAEVMTALGDTVAATSEYDRCVALDPEHPAAWRRLFHARVTAGGAGAAAAGVRAVVASPTDRDLAVTVGRILAADLARASDALPLIRGAADARPDQLGPQVLLYRTAVAAGESDLAVAAVDRAATVAPEDREVLFDRASVLCGSGRTDRAIDAVAAYVQACPDDGDGHGRLAVALAACGGFATVPARAGAWQRDAQMLFVLGEAFYRAGRSGDAIDALERAIALGAIPAAVHHLILSAGLDTLGRPDEAIARARLAAGSDPDRADALGWLGTLLVREGDSVQGRAVLERALARDPDHAASLCGLAQLAVGQLEHDRGWDLYRRAVAAAPADPGPCAAGLLAMNAHPTLDPATLSGLHREWARRIRGRTPPPDRAWANAPDPDRRLRVGYASPDLRAHPVGQFAEPLLASHDRAAFEVLVFDSSPSPDAVAERIRQGVDGWFRVVGAGDDQVAEWVRQQRIDILVDLAGHTTHSRINVFARHPAPVQVSYLGYPNTTGLTEIDYRLTDAVADPPGAADAVHTERLVRLPGGFLCFNPPRPWAPVGPPPAEWPGVTFASFNAVHKINRDVIDLWTRVLDAVPGSRLLMKAVNLSNDQTRRGMMAAFADRGVAGDRLVLVERTASHLEHLAVYNRCDVALDTFPYNGTTTTCEALWMGVPVVAMAGDRHASRVSLSILTHAGLPELAGDTPDAFVQVAVGLAQDRPRLAELRRTLRERLRVSRLMDAQAHARAVEDAYRTMWRTWCAVATGSEVPA